MEFLRAGYLFVFGLSAVACFTASWRARRISDRDTRVGLVALLLLSGAWATASFARLLPYPQTAQQMFYIFGLVTGLASVGAWLYFCSAYTGHDYHHNPRIRMVAITIFTIISIVKFTNPLHNLYFSATTVTTPFVHTVLNLHTMHWVVTGFAYTCSGVGFYLLYELFSNSDFQTTSLGWLVVLTGVPAVFDIIAYTEIAPRLLLKFNYEPIGVALFAVGALYIVDGKFVVVPRFWRQEVLENLNEGIIVVDADDRIRDWNNAATGMFPQLSDARGSAFENAVPSLLDIDNTDKIVKLDHGVETLYYQVHERELVGPSGQARGRIFTCTDVSDIERHRRELQRQSEQFDDFADAIAHELRNSTTVIDGYLKLVAEQLVKEDAPPDDEPITVAVNEVERLKTVIEELSIMARLGQPIDRVATCDLHRAVEAGFEQSKVEGLTYELISEMEVQATDQHLQTLFRGLFVFLDAIGASNVRITPSDNEIEITSDGQLQGAGTVEQALRYGEPVPSEDTGMALPNVRMVARSLRWQLNVDQVAERGICIRIEDVSTN